MNPSPYEILGVTQEASQDEIKNAYRKLAKKLHPDLNPGNAEAEKRFKEINNAYERVGTAEERVKFDRGESEAAQFAGAEGANRSRRGPFYQHTQQGGGRYTQQYGDANEDFLNSIFSRMGRDESSQEARGRDALYQMDIELKDAILGAEKEISLPGGKDLRVKIPPGVESGTKLRFAGRGSAGLGGAPAGDALVELNVKPSSVFNRRGKDLEIEILISLAEAVLGGSIQVPTIDGSVLLTVPPQVGVGQRLRIPGKGVPSRGSESSGDQIVSLKVVLPKEMDPEFKQALEAWQKRQPYNPREAS